MVDAYMRGEYLIIYYVQCAEDDQSLNHDDDEIDKKSYCHTVFWVLIKTSLQVCSPAELCATIISEPFSLLKFPFYFCK